MRTAAAIGLATFAFGFVWASLGGPPMEQDVYEVCPPLTERSSYRTDLTTWPPGATRCEVSYADGTAAESIHVPWREWLAVALFAVGAALAWLAVRRPRFATASASATLVLAGLAVWFVGPPA